jgi:hypothetical protein
MLTYEINIICDGQTANERCNEMICTEPDESGSAQRALVFAAEQGWQIVAIEGAVQTYCPECQTPEQNGCVSLPPQLGFPLGAPSSEQSIGCPENRLAIGFDGNSSSSSRDIEVSNQGTISLLRPLTPKGRQWLATHCPTDFEHQYLGDALAVEARYLASILVHAQEDGLNLGRGGRSL